MAESMLLTSMEILELSTKLGHSRRSSNVCGWKGNLWKFEARGAKRPLLPWVHQQPGQGPKKEDFIPSLSILAPQEGNPFSEFYFWRHGNVLGRYPMRLNAPGDLGMEKPMHAEKPYHSVKGGPVARLCTEGSRDLKAGVMGEGRDPTVLPREKKQSKLSGKRHRL